MDFLADFQSAIDLGAEETITVKRKPLEPQEKDVKPYLDEALRAGDDKGSRARFLVDAGGTTLTKWKTAQQLALQ